MKLEDYNTIIKFIHQHSSKCSRAVLADLVSKFGDTQPYHTLVSIFLNDLQKRVKRTYHSKSKENEVKLYIGIYEKRIEKCHKRMEIKNSTQDRATYVDRDVGGIDNDDHVVKIDEKNNAAMQQKAASSTDDMDSADEVAKKKGKTSGKCISASAHDSIMENHSAASCGDPTKNGAATLCNGTIKNKMTSPNEGAFMVEPVLITLANEFEIPPYLMARLVVEWYVARKREALSRNPRSCGRSTVPFPSKTDRLEKTMAKADLWNSVAKPPTSSVAHDGCVSTDSSSGRMLLTPTDAHGPSTDVKEDGWPSASPPRTGTQRNIESATLSAELGDARDLASHPTVKSALSETCSKHVGPNDVHKETTSLRKMTVDSEKGNAPSADSTAWRGNEFPNVSDSSNSNASSSMKTSKSGISKTGLTPQPRRIALAAVDVSIKVPNVKKFVVPESCRVDVGQPTAVEPKSSNVVISARTSQSGAQKDGSKDTENRHKSGEETSVMNTQTSVKNQVALFMKDPHMISDEMLREQVLLCASYDVCYGPINDAIRHAIGLEYEAKLVRLVKEHQLPFLDENDLRKRGYDKTPDIKLEVPIAVDGHPVCWIESKASFGDQDTHGQYLSAQYYSYWNRFGPGLVIYWFGFIDDISDEMLKQRILIMDGFPSSDKITFMSP